METQYCLKEGHKRSVLNLVCMDLECTQRGLVCNACVQSQHNDHSKNCIPLKKVFQALNKANNPKTKDELGIIGNDILKRHCNLFSKFRRYVTAISDSIKSLETAIEKKMNELKEESQVFVGNMLEKSLEKLNDPNVKAPIIQEELQRLFPLIQLSQDEPGELECLGVAQKQREAERITRLAELLERECRFWMEKSLEDLKKLENNILIATRKKPVFKESECRFGGLQTGWTLGGTEALTFEVNKPQDVWLTGIGAYEITKWPEDNQLSLKVSILQGNSTNSKSIYEETLLLTKAECVPKKSISTQNDRQARHTIQLKFKQAIKLEAKQAYTIMSKPSAKCISYYGYNGCVETKDFIFKDCVFNSETASNSTGTIQGQFPVFYFEE